MLVRDEGSGADRAKEDGHHAVGARRGRSLAGTAVNVHTATVDRGSDRAQGPPSTSSLPRRSGTAVSSGFLRRPTELRPRHDLDAIGRAAPAAGDRFDGFAEDLGLVNRGLTSHVEVPELAHARGPHDVESGEVAAVRAAQATLGIRQGHGHPRTLSVVPSADVCPVT